MYSYPDRSEHVHVTTTQPWGLQKWLLILAIDVLTLFKEADSYRHPSTSGEQNISWKLLTDGRTCIECSNQLLNCLLTFSDFQTSKTGKSFQNTVLFWPTDVGITAVLGLAAHLGSSPCMFRFYWSSHIACGNEMTAGRSCDQLVSGVCRKTFAQLEAEPPVHPCPDSSDQSHQCTGLVRGTPP